MGSTNFGAQTKAVEFNADAADFSFNRRLTDILATGIYKGGLLKIVDVSNFILRPLVCNILDINGVYQVRIETESDEQIAADIANPYVILKWSYGQVVGQNYMDVVLTNDPSVYFNYLIVGKQLFTGSDLTGFTYGEGDAYKRSYPDNAENHFKAIGNSGAAVDERDMWVTGGRLPDIDGGGNITKTLEIDTQKVTFAVNGSPKTYYIYYNRSVDPSPPIINTAYPNGKNWVVVAKADIPAGSDPVALSAITDLRRYVW